MKCDLLFVYGTLRRRLASPMFRVLARHASFAGTGTFRGKLFEIRGYPGVVPSTRRGDEVVGELYRLNNQAAVFAVLDDYEMCSDKFPEPREYRRDVVAIAAEGGIRVRAWTYIYNLPTGRLRRIASGDYLAPDGMRSRSSSIRRRWQSPVRS